MIWLIYLCWMIVVVEMVIFIYNLLRRGAKYRGLFIGMLCFLSLIVLILRRVTQLISLS